MIASQWVLSVSFCAVVLFVLVVPIVIWVVKLVIWIATALAFALASLIAYNLYRVAQGRKMYWPRSPWAWARWVVKALNAVPFGG